MTHIEAITSALSQAKHPKPFSDDRTETEAEGYTEWQLRQAIADAMRRIGRKKVIEVINEEIAA
jgi:hypothetical protein